ncbi:TetR/AcrR family transcriptional regulator [Roseomonas sp. AR75]|uniref:TetR/AcrR family transcriptional regulator n=1 Tax=Roseomonas sp. AR75 TaxID=2562311 RepID=UPI0014854566|nr:TetR/AcrR family transcriptional regulator [Roseomonas sp. AR75]
MSSSRVATPRRRAASARAGHAFDRDAQREQKRRALLHEAARLINARGAGAVSLEDVGSGLSISKAAVYYYFRSKQDLLAECYSMSFDVWEGALDAAEAAGSTGAAKVELFIRRYLADGLSALQPMILVREQEALQAPLRQRVEKRRKALRNRLRGFIAQGVADGSFRPLDARVATTVIGAAISWLLRTYREDGPLSREAFIESAVGLLLQGMRA